MPSISVGCADNFETDLLASHPLRLGITSILYAYKLPNGKIEYSPLEFQYSSELDAAKIVNDLRLAENLMPSDTVAVNIAAYVFR